MMAQGTTIIATGTHIEGEVNAQSNLHIDGFFEGKITCHQIVSIGQGGHAKGEIIADKLVVSGKFNGKADCKIIEIMPHGRVDGEIITNELVIEREGFFVGESRVKNDPHKAPHQPPTPNKTDSEHDHKDQ